MREQACRNCRHWGDPPMQLQKDGSVQPGEWHECQRLFVVTSHTYGDIWKAGRCFEKGDVVTGAQVIRFDLAVDRLHTGESFGCSGWEAAVRTPDQSEWWEEGAA